ncbi:voltage-dependent anion channel [Aspergillus coremiiformis]|uniref:Voltage-dependent anion channel n=1 Tax=Aspergillus coremiiformis TaxID=138285 RepID=A0A5N6Z5C4_9EURO|nr:voltage-dependent anion channel [Aspergillus coremiiformis]
MAIVDELRRILRELSPLWFSVALGTGMTAMLLHQLPYNASAIRWIAIALFAFNIFLFCFLLVLSVLRFILYPFLLRIVLLHNAQVFSLPLIPMSFATLINLTVWICTPVWGPWVTILAWVLWWIDATLSFVMCSILIFGILWTHDMRSANMTTTWLLPFLAPIVAASSGGLVAEALDQDSQVIPTLITAFVLWSVGFLPAMALIILYAHRLLEYKMPSRQQVMSLVLPVGPFGLGSLGIQSHNGIHGISLLTAIPFWACGLWWLVFAITSAIRARTTFNLEWWSTTFPTGALALATVQIGRDLASDFMKILGMVLSAGSILLWLVCFLGTVRMMVNKSILSSSYMAEIYPHTQGTRRSSV